MNTEYKVPPRVDEAQRKLSKIRNHYIRKAFAECTVAFDGNHCTQCVRENGNTRCCECLEEMEGGD